jgi:hypothetical protein
MTSDKRYQIFISSTFRDLVDERQEVLKAVLELNHMPAGMELFPAADEAAWQLIKDVIDGSDYYILVVGGKYGSLDETGLGYTEKEYDYAVTSKKPVIALLHKEPEKIPREKTETDSAAWKKLKKFRAKVEKNHTCSYWLSAEDLKSKVIVALTSTTKRHPRIGWVRSDQVPSEATLADVLSLRQRVAELEQQLASERTEAPAGTVDLAQGEDAFEVAIDYTVGKQDDWKDEEWKGEVYPTWNEVFAALAPLMMNEASRKALRSRFEELLHEVAIRQRSSDEGMEGKLIKSLTVPDRALDTVIVQLRALGLIRVSERKRSIQDRGAYWTLTPYGDRLMVQLRALRRDDAVPPESGDVDTESAEAETK